VRRTVFVLLSVASFIVRAPAASLGTEEAAAEANASGGPLTADFNGDGFADLGVAVPQEDVNGQTNAGAVHVLYGSSGGLQADAPDDQVWHQDVTGVEDSAEQSDHFGWAVAAADFNGDDLADLAIGVYQENVGSIVDAGAINVLYGSAAGLQVSSPPDQHWNQDSPGVGSRAEPNDNFGRSLGIGDFNGDGFADLAVGVPSQDVGTRTDAGAINVLYGSPTGLQAESPDDQIWWQNAAGVGDVSEQRDQFGWSLAGGDFNGDGFADLVVGVNLEDVGAVADAGAAAVLYGGPGGLQATAPDDQLWTQNSAGVLDTAETGDSLGLSVAAGDFNGDGFEDLVIGILTEDVAAIRDAGAAAVLYGSSAGLQANAPGDQLWTQDASGVEETAEAGDQFSHALAPADYNGDGFADLGIGVHHEDLGATTEAGLAHVLYGSAGGLQANTPADQLWHQDIDGVEDTAETFDAFALALGAGDYDGDGFADLVVGVRDEGVGAASDAGAVNALYGSAAGIQSAGDQLWHEDVAGVEEVAEAEDEFGWKLT
jgi:hypothetical protein